jgi:hypothetical protein
MPFTKHCPLPTQARLYVGIAEAQERLERLSAPRSEDSCFRVEVGRSGRMEVFLFDHYVGSGQTEEEALEAGRLYLAASRRYEQEWLLEAEANYEKRECADCATCPALRFALNKKYAAAS